MVTLFRMIRIWQLKTKWRLAFLQFLDRQATELISHPKELEKKFVDALTELIHSTDMEEAP